MSSPCACGGVALLVSAMKVILCLSATGILIGFTWGTFLSWDMKV